MIIFQYLMLIFAPFLIIGLLVSTGVVDAEMWNQFKEIYHIKGFLFF